jgi:signal transduction histidine kinase
LRGIAGLGKRTALRAGYGAVIALLALSVAEAYRIQVSVSARHLEIYERYAAESEAVATLRRNVWLAGNYVRDFFIRTTPAQAEILRGQLRELRTEDENALQFLAHSPGRSDTVPKLRKSLGELWDAIGPVGSTMMPATSNQKFEFLEREIVPRRGQLYTALMDLATADQVKLQEVETAFAAARRGATNHLLLLLCCGVLLSLLVAIFSIRHAESLERKADLNLAAIERARGELQELSARLLEVEEEGRRRLARELHDEIGQALALLQIEISRAQAVPSAFADPLRERLQRAHELAEKTVQTVRNISLLLRPSLLDDLGLVPALQFQLEDFMRRNTIACEFVESGVADDLPDAAKTCVYRVVQEALHNCEKHSSATRVRVLLRQEPASLLAEIQDNGHGFALKDDAAPLGRTGLGLLGIRERASIAGGSREVHSAPGEGTRISLRIPIHRVSAANGTGVREVTA